jgi:hypothetical protein
VVLPRRLRLRMLASQLAARGLGESMLDLLLELDDLPPGWILRREASHRLGFLHIRGADRRARQQKLISVQRQFVQPEARTDVILVIAASATIEDAHARLAVHPARARRPPHFHAQWTDSIEVAPPPEAGSHARAFLTTITSNERAPQRKLLVKWIEAEQPLLCHIHITAPAVLDVSELASTLIECQRQRIAQRVTPAPG